MRTQLLSLTAVLFVAAGGYQPCQAGDKDKVYEVGKDGLKITGEQITLLKAIGLDMRTPATLEDIRTRLQKDEIAIVYTMGRESSYLVLIEKQAGPGDKTNGIAIHALKSAGEISGVVRALTEVETLILPARVRVLARQCYDLVLAPVASRIKGKHLVIVPDGVLASLPFELLVDGAEQGQTQYLVEKHRVRYAPSLSALKLIREWETTRAKPDRNLWAIGDPIYGGADDRLEPKQTKQTHADDFPRCKFGGVAMTEISKLLRASDDDIFFGLRATTEAVENASKSGRLARSRYVLFAAHGNADLGPGRDPCLVLSRSGKQGKNHDRLGARDIANLKLNADVVILIACSSASRVGKCVSARW